MAVRTDVAFPPRARPRHTNARMTIPGAHARLCYRGRPLIMGILNVTPDSFSDGGTYRSPEAALRRGLAMAQEGADLIDIGGESTRPGSRGVPLEEELRRTIPVVRRLAKVVSIPISIDTRKSEVALRALDAGASVVNDVTALRADGRMASVIARTRAAVVLLHMRGSPETMQRAPRYHDVVNDIAGFLDQAIARAMQAGIARSRILVDPGLGFGKTLHHNLALMQRLDRFVALGVPVVIGPSRKSFIGTVLHADVEERLAGTLACVAAAWWHGVKVVRVHDVKPALQLIQMLEAIEVGDASRRER